MKPVYDKIGIEYSLHRSADPRISNKIISLLNLPTNSVIMDIGAGTGNYSHALSNNGFIMKAVEPSDKMISQASNQANIEWIKACAEDIPLPNNSVDGVIIILAMHHFKSIRRAIDEISRICPNGPIIIFTYDPRESNNFWLCNYFPKICNEALTVFPPIQEIAKELSGSSYSYEFIKFPLPTNLSDSFMAAKWNKPEEYLDEKIRKCMSPFALADNTIVEEGVSKLKRDLKSGLWDEHYGQNRLLSELDVGYSFIKLRVKKDKM